MALMLRSAPSRLATNPTAVDEMGGRIDELEKSLGELMQQAGAQGGGAGAGAGSGAGAGAAAGGQ